jgi:ABC-2 type transport system permease protein
MIWNVLRTVGQHSRLKIAAILVLGGGIWLSLFALPLYGFTWIADPSRYGLASVPEQLVSLFFFLLAVLLVFSNAVIAYSAMFRSPETWFLRSCPIPSGTVFLYKLAESLTFSSWAFVMLGVPIMLAYGWYKEAPFYYYPAIFIFFMCFVLIPAGLGSLLALLVSTIFRGWMRRFLTGITVAGIVIILAVGPSLIRRETDRGTLIAPNMLARIGFTDSAYWPSAWIARGLIACAEPAGPGSFGDVAYYLGLLASNSLFICLAAHALARRTYTSAWDRIHSTSSHLRGARLDSWLVRLTPSSPTLSLILKDLKTFVRDPVQWTQCAVLFGLLALYILNLRNLRYPSEHPMWRNMTTFLNLASICLVLATLTTRFVFPMFSLEGHRFWLLGLVPVSRSRILWSKFLFSFLGSLAITETLMIMSDLMLGEPVQMMVLHVFTVAMISLGLSGLSVGLSALFPNLRETNPAKIVSGFGGTLNLILSLVYVSVVVVAEAIPVHLRAIGRLSPRGTAIGVSISIGVLVVLTLAAFGIPMRLGARKLRQMEF